MSSLATPTVDGETIATDASGRSTAASSTPRCVTGTRQLQVVDCHAAGEPARVVVGGAPHVPGDTTMEKREYFMENLDALRKLLLLEPRGYPCQNADVIVPATPGSGAAYGFLILEQNKIYPAMSGHNTMCVATALLETGMVPMEEPTTRFSLEAPAGVVNIEAECQDGKALSIGVRNVASFSHAHDLEVDVPELGKVTVDVAYGGMWYVIVDASSVGLRLDPANGKDISRLGEMIKIATRDQHPVQHPTIDYPGPDILVFRGPPSPGSGAHSKNAVVMSNKVLDWDDPQTWSGMIDRSPCGTGTCAVMANLWSKGELGLSEDFVHESIIGTTFTGRLLEETRVGDVPAVIPSIRGPAWITQYATVLCHPTDPFPEGYTVADIW